MQTAAPPIGDRLLTLREAADVLRLSTRTMRDYLQRGEIELLKQSRETINLCAGHTPVVWDRRLPLPRSTNDSAVVRAGCSAFSAGDGSLVLPIAIFRGAGTSRLAAVLKGRGSAASAILVSSELKQEARSFGKSRVFWGVFVKIWTPTNSNVIPAVLHPFHYPFCAIETPVL